VKIVVPHQGSNILTSDHYNPLKQLTRPNKPDLQGKENSLIE
jgi:hypothetical protein